MISPSDRALAVELIQEVSQNGARLAPACKELDISVRTYERWVSEGGVKEDQRPIVPRPEPKSKLTIAEKQEMLEILKMEEFANLPPTQIVPKLADQCIYIASESSFYCVIREQNMQHHRGRSKRPERKLPESICNSSKSSLDIGYYLVCAHKELLKNLHFAMQQNNITTSVINWFI
ncbi:transposase [Neobacillus niacini]|uniref:hypothetical protein n=1 Tax=Neobacillus niacini TaxID=86668 RepID=UPI00285C2CFE|nr:hypothetical protein [Neobacillus niacini]MDR7080010.1 transposase [Neobacillus niacini]